MCCFKKEKCESLDCFVTAPRPIYAYGKCGAWLSVHKLPITLQEHVKSTKTDHLRFFSARKIELVTRQTILQKFPILINQIKKKRIVCGQQITKDYWRCVMSNK